MAQTMYMVTYTSILNVSLSPDLIPNIIIIQLLDAIILISMISVI